MSIHSCMKLQDFKNKENIDPYRQYVGQEGHNMNKCATFDEQNVQHALCRLTVQSTTSPCVTPLDNYMTLNNPITEKIVSCQNITPSYYPDMTQQMIGKRPVYTTRYCEYTIPETIIKNKDNLARREFACTQPNWCWNCM